MSATVIDSLMNMANLSQMSQRHACAIIYKKHTIVACGYNYTVQLGLSRLKECQQFDQRRERCC
jgi:deoxycytidylate deaminase